MPWGTAHMAGELARPNAKSPPLNPLDANPQKWSKEEGKPVVLPRNKPNGKRWFPGGERTRGGVNSKNRGGFALG